MTDIVERLRDWGHPDWFYVNTDLLSDNQDVRLDAADEIERLRFRLQYMESKYGKIDWDAALAPADGK